MFFFLVAKSLNHSKGEEEELLRAKQCLFVDLTEMMVKTRYVIGTCNQFLSFLVSMCCELSTQFSFCLQNTWIT